MTTLKISDIATKNIIDSEGEISLAVKATIKNLSDETDIYASIQGIDRDGFEVILIGLSGDIPIGESKVLTTREEFIDQLLLKEVVEWRGC